MDTKALAYQYFLSARVTLKNLEGITHEHSVLQPKADGNCLNWNLGHMVRTRIKTLNILGKTSPLPIDLFEAYGDAPVTDSHKAIAWSSLIDHYNALQKPIEDALHSMTAEQLGAKPPFSLTGNADETVGSLLAGLAFHEAYHCGQIGLGRRLAGLPGVIGARKPASAGA